MILYNMKRKRVLIPIILFTIIIIVLAAILSFSRKYIDISISEKQWNSIINTRSENNEIKLQEISFNDYHLVIDENNNTLYYSLINESKNKYNPSVRYMTTSQNTKIAILSDEITDDKVKSDYEFKIMIYTENEYRIYNLVCTDFPILNITYQEDVEYSQKNIPMEFYLFNNLNNTTNRVTISDGKFRTDENGYTFSLKMKSPGKSTRENRVSILSMKPHSEYTLTFIENDSGEINMEMLNENFDKIPRDNRVLVFINDEFKGIYTLGTTGKEINSLGNK